MAATSNIPREIQDSIRDVLDRRIKISIRRMVKQEVRADKTENRVVAFSPCRMFVLAAKVPSKVEHSFHFLDFQALESKKPNQLVVTVEGKNYTFTSIDATSEEVNHMITHIGVSLKQIFPAFPLERLIRKVEVTPPERLRTMGDMIRGVESKEAGPCGGFTTQYMCMCDYHGLPYREEVAWDVDTIYLSQDSRELCLRDFDHLHVKDSVPIIGALEHNTWFTSLNGSNCKLSPEALNEILKVMKRNAVIERLNLANTGIKTDFLQKLSTALLSNSGTQLSCLDLSGNLLEDRGVTHLMGTLKSLARGLNHLDLSRAGLTTRCLNKTADTIAQSQTLLSSLQTLKMADNGQKGEDMASLYLFLSQPNMMTTLDLSSTDAAMDSLVSPLLMGCPHLCSLILARTTFTHKRTKEAVVPVAWRQFFASTCNLQKLDVSGTRIPAEAVKEMLLGIGSNRHLKDLDLDLSSNDLGSAGAQVISGCIANILCLGRLDISNNGFDVDLKTLLPEVAKNRHLKHLAIGRNFSSVKPKHMWSVLDAVVQLLQAEETMLESLSLADSRLKQDTAFIINALGSNNTLTYIDLSGNAMGDFGARMLCKALQINTRLHTVVWDKNGLTAQGFKDVADALEKNYTVKQMPFPVNDAAVAMRTQAEHTETALQKIEQLLQRNHSPRRFASDQQYRLQQGFLISSTQQMVDRLCVQVQDAVNALKIANSGASEDDLEQAEKVVKDADNSKQLLPKLQVIAMETQDPGNAVETTLQTMADKLRAVMEETMQKTVEDMLKCTGTYCDGVMSDKAFCSEVETGCKSRSTLPKDFAKVLLDGITFDVFNKLSELNLAVAAYISDSVIDEVISKLSDSHKDLSGHLHLRKSGHVRDSTASRDQVEKTDTDSEKEKAKEEDNEGEGKDVTDGRTRQSSGGSPRLSSKRKSVFSRKLRPQSVIDEIEDAEVKSPTPLQKVPEVLSKGPTPKGSTESLDRVSELPQLEVQKLEHINKARPKRFKTRAASRPVAPGFSGGEEAADDGINTFYVPRANLAEPEPDLEKGKEPSKERSSSSSSSKLAPEDSVTHKPEKKKWSPMSYIKDKTEKKEDKEKKEEKKEKGPSFSAGISNFFRNKGSKADAKDKEKKQEAGTHKDRPDSGLPTQTDSSKVYTRNSKVDSPQSQQPDSTLSMTPSPTPPPVTSLPTQILADSPKVVAPPAASAEKGEQEDAVSVGSKTSGSGEVKRSDSGKEEERSRSSKSNSKSSTPDEGVKEEGETGAEDQEEKGEEGEKGEEPSPHPRVHKNLTGMGIGFGANVLADLKAQKRFSTRLPSPETETKDDKADSPVLPSKAEKVETDRKKEETNNNNGVTGQEKDEPSSKEKPPPPKTEKPSTPPAPDSNGAPARVPLLPPSKPGSADNEAAPKPAPRALLPKKPPTVSASVESGKPGSSETAPVPKPRPTPPTKPRPPITAPKPKPSVKRDSPPSEEDPNGSSGEAASNAGDAKVAEGEIVYDSSTLRMSVKDKIKRLSQVKFEPPASSGGPKKAASLPRDAKVPSSVTEECEEEEQKNGDSACQLGVVDTEGDGDGSSDRGVRRNSKQGVDQDDPSLLPSADDEIMV